MGCPSMKISPLVVLSKPASMRRRVVLPQPEAPNSEKNSPCLISIDTPSMALNDPNTLLTFRMEMKASEVVMNLGVPDVVKTDARDPLCDKDQRERGE